MRGLRLDARDRDVLVVWGAFLVGVWCLAGAAGWMVADRGVSTPELGWLERWGQWDFIHFQGIADVGYGGRPTGVPNEAFFPGLPLLLRLGGWLGLPDVGAGVIVSAVAGGVAAVALGRLARATTATADGGPARDPGTLAVLAWVAAPSAVFLAAPYTESLFLALALPAWLAARSGRWPAVGVLAAGACLVRVSGVFLVAALAVAWLAGTDPRTLVPRRHWSDLAWLALPLAALAGWMAYLHAVTGDWLAWMHAQEEEWHRTFTLPWDALRHTWEAAAGPLDEASFTWMFRAELVAMGVGMLLTVALVLRRHWAEATWVGLQVGAFATSYWFFSVPRATLLWWPLWLLLGGLGTRRPRLFAVYVAASAGSAAVIAVAYLTSRWAG